MAPVGLPFLPGRRRSQTGQIQDVLRPMMLDEPAEPLPNVRQLGQQTLREALLPYTTPERLSAEEFQAEMPIVPALDLGRAFEPEEIADASIVGRRRPGIGERIADALASTRAGAMDPDSENFVEQLLASTLGTAGAVRRGQLERQGEERDLSKEIYETAVRERRLRQTGDILSQLRQTQMLENVAQGLTALRPKAPTAYEQGIERRLQEMEVLEELGLTDDPEATTNPGAVIRRHVAAQSRQPREEEAAERRRIAVLEKAARGLAKGLAIRNRQATQDDIHATLLEKYGELNEHLLLGFAADAVRQRPARGGPVVAFAALEAELKAAVQAGKTDAQILADIAPKGDQTVTAARGMLPTVRQQVERKKR